MTALAEGPDGTLYYGTFAEVYRITPTGGRVRIAGTGITGYSGDGGLATAAQINVVALTVGPDGAVFIGSNNRIRRVGLDGTISTVLGNGTFTSSGNDGFAGDATTNDTRSMTFGSDGALYVVEYIANSPFDLTIRRIDRGGKVTHFAGYNGSAIPTSEAIEANSWRLFGTTTIAPTTDGGLLVSTQVPVGASRAGLVRKVTPDGRVVTVAGRTDILGQTDTGMGGPASRAILDARKVALATDGTVFIQENTRIVQVRPPTPDIDVGSVAIASQDGREVYTFDATGRHVETRNTQRNVVTAQIAYDTAGLLSSITDEHGLTTTIERDATGEPTAIEGPYGHRTTLTLNADGWLETVTDPTNDSTDLAWNSTTGLLAGFSTRNGNQTTFQWDVDGRLASHTHAGGGTRTLTRTETPTGYEVEMTSALGRTRTFVTETTSTLAETRENTGPSGLTSTRVRTTGERFTSTSADGTVRTTQMGPDPRFGMRSPVPAQSSTTLPSGLTRLTEQARTATLSNSADPFSMTAWTMTSKINGRTTTTSYNLATRVETTTSPAGRITTSLFDAQGKVLRVDAPDVEPIFFAYDTDGRLLSTSQGTRASTRTYGTDGLLATLTNPLSQTTSFARNARGDVLFETRPDAETTGFLYDGEGNTTSVTPPDKPAHTMSFNEIEELESYAPPGITQPGAGATTYEYNLDKQLELVSQPGPRDVEYAYDAAGRLEEITFPTGIITRSYSPTTGHLTEVEGPDGITMSMTYDGPIQKSVTFSGGVSGTVAWTHDTDFRVITETVNGTWPAAFAFDPDSLLTSAGSLTLTRDAESGRVTAATAGDVTDAYTHNEYGEVATRTTSFGGVPFFELAYERDDLGRITEKTETVGGITTVTEYAYDDVGRLTTVTTDGDLTESYGYDANGNRTSSLNAEGVFGATFDAQDRIVGYGANIEYEFTENGELATRTDTSTGDVTAYEYDAVGNLRAVTLPNGDLIEYLVDGAGRRVGRSYNGVFERGWLWRGQLQPVAEVDAAGNVVARYVYAGGVNSPELIVTAGATYRLVKDHLGSVRFVVDVATGAVVQELAYDSWGRVVLDTSPGLQPFGFAGGLYEAETGLVRFGARDYDAEVGRWTSRDPIRFDGGINLFEYAASNPVALRDPTGRNPAAPALRIGFRATLRAAGASVATYAIERAIGGAAGIAIDLAIDPTPVGDYDCDDGTCGPMAPPAPIPAAPPASDAEPCPDEYPTDADFEQCRPSPRKQPIENCCRRICADQYPPPPGSTRIPVWHTEPYFVCMQRCRAYYGLPQDKVFSD